MEGGNSGLVKKKPSGLKLNVTQEKQFNLHNYMDEKKIPLEYSKSNLIMKPENFKVIKVLGVGSQGKVYLCQYIPTNIMVARKDVLVTSEEDVKIVRDEIASNQTIMHKNIVQFFGCFINPDQVSMIIEFMDMGTLGKLIGFRVPEPILSYICRNILTGLNYLNHERKIVHRDIKPNNVLINSNGEIKISDFGISKMLDRTEAKSKTFVGTQLYMSPERIQGDLHGLLSDIWSAGVMFYQLALGSFPFNIPPNSAFIDTLDTIVNKPMVPFPNDFSPMLRDFLTKCLQKDPAYRLRSSALLNHDFITTHQNVTQAHFVQYIRSLQR